MFNLNNKWNEIIPNTTEPVFSLFKRDHPVRIYLGKTIENHKLLLIVTPDEVPNQKDMKEISVQKVQKENAEWGLILTLRDNSLSEQFSFLCEDIINVSQHAKDERVGTKLILQRLVNWRRLLESKPLEILSMELIRGLFGELTFLSLMLKQNQNSLPGIVNGWKGPLGGEQDFQNGEKAWEIKTIRENAKSVHISSENQLSSKLKMQLLIYTLNESGKADQNAISLNSIIGEIRNQLSENFEAFTQFEEKLLLVGYQTRIEYDSPMFSVSDLNIYEIKENFPHLSRHSIPTSITCVKYDLNLQACEEFVTNKVSQWN